MPRAFLWAWIARQVPLRAALARLASSERCAVRSRDRQRPVAIPWVRSQARAARQYDAVLRVHARHARSVVQARISAQAREEVALLAVGRISRAAGCPRRAVH